jgi:hypothetical protein
LTVQGNGDQYFGGVSAIHGDLVVQSSTGTETLHIQGTFDDSAGSGIFVNAGGMLKGTGTILGSVSTAGGGVYAPGNSPGAQTISGNLNFNSPAISGTDHPILEFDLNSVPSSGVAGTNWDKVSVGGMLSINGNTSSTNPITLVIDSVSSGNTGTPTAGFNSLGSYQWNFITVNPNYGYQGPTFNTNLFNIDYSTGGANASGLAASFLTANGMTSLPAGYGFWVDYTNNVLSVDYGPINVVPEPGSALLAALASAGLAGYGWLRRRGAGRRPS